MNKDQEKEFMQIMLLLSKRELNAARERFEALSYEQQKEFNQWMIKKEYFNSLAVVAMRMVVDVFSKRIDKRPTKHEKYEQGEEVEMEVTIPMTYTVGDTGAFSGEELLTTEDIKNEIIAELDHRGLCTDDLIWPRED